MHSSNVRCHKNKIPNEVSKKMFDVSYFYQNISFQYTKIIEFLCYSIAKYFYQIFFSPKEFRPYNVKTVSKMVAISYFQCAWNGHSRNATAHRVKGMSKSQILLKHWISEFQMLSRRSFYENCIMIPVFTRNCYTEFCKAHMIICEYILVSLWTVWFDFGMN